MRILQILPELNLGGVEKGTIELSKYLALNGHYPIVISNGGKLERELQEFGIKHYKLPVHKKSLFSIRLVPKILKILKKEHIDILHARSRVPAILGYLAFSKYIRDINIAEFLQFSPSFITTAHGYYSKHIFSKIMAKGKLVICPSQVIAKHMMEDFNVSLSKIHVIPRGVNISEYDFILPSEKDWKHPIVAIIARLSPIKGHPEFIKAFRELLKIKPFSRAWIIGSPSPGKEEYFRELEILVKRYGLENTVDFMGTRYDITDLLKKINILVQPSRIPESFGRVIIEAQAAGVPVVATSLGGYKEIIENNKTGFLVPPGDGKCLAQTLIKAVKNISFCDDMAISARERVEKLYSLDKVNKSIIEAYKKAGSDLSVLIIKFGALGDAVLAIPSTRAIREKFPRARIFLLTSANVAPVFKNCPYIDKLLIYPSFNLKYQGLVRCVKQIRKIAPEISIDLQHNKLSRLIAYLSGIYQRYGFLNGKFSVLLNKGQRLSQEVLSPVDHQMVLLSKLGIRSIDKELELWVEDAQIRKSEEFLETHWLSKKQALVGINVGASNRWSSKRWPLKRIVELIDELGAYNIRCLITGVKEDEEDARGIMNICKNKPINAVGKTGIPDLIALIKKCDLFFTPDSAPLHIAAAVKTPVLAIFGPTDPGRHLPLGENVYYIWKKLDCAPCYRAECKKQKECMQLITVEEVLNKILEIMKDKINTLSG
ncbi:MAG: glycosyltransferase family 9 protein [Candidatus Saelkia tenebricola]|nr:glycosyltransferase family 9 protein [Candidatus Saelkia tenebricola]